MCPCMWVLNNVFPAHAGVFLHVTRYALLRAGIPRSRGGVSIPVVPMGYAASYSPLTRGCFLPPRIYLQDLHVFPAHAGVFLLARVFLSFCLCIPRSRGGVSAMGVPSDSPQMYSPLTRGCFCMACRIARTREVFPAHAGVFPRLQAGALQIPRIPRSRGGVSQRRPFQDQALQYSPLTRGCFQRGIKKPGWADVFPAHAGVFLPATSARMSVQCIPRSRGGVSHHHTPNNLRYGYSPLTRGCFFLLLLQPHSRYVFPAHAGVFLLQNLLVV